MRPIAELPLAGFDVLWDDLRLGAVPFPLEVRSHGETLDERARIKAAVYTELTRRRLARADRPTPELEDALRLLATPEVSLTLVVMHDQSVSGPVNALVAARGQQAVMAVQREHTIGLTEVRDTAIIAALIDLLPGNRPGPGRSITMPNPAHGRQDEPGGLLRPMTTQAAGQNELRQITAVMERPVQRAGMLGITLRDPRGKLLRLPGITWLDNDQGRYALSLKRGPDGKDWTTLSPADSPRLATWLGEALASARS
jgi:hypothetical protein